MTEAKKTPAVEDGQDSGQTFDRAKLAELTTLAQGERSILEFSNDSGVNRGLIGEIKSGKTAKRPTKTTLMKLTDPVKARPRNNVSLNDMLKACGYKMMEIPTRDVGKMSFEDAVVQTFTKSPTKPMTMLLDYLISTEQMNDYRVDVHGGWFKLTRSGKAGREVGVGIGAFCDHDLGAKAMMITIKALLLDTVATKEDAEGLSEKTYYLLTDRDDVYEYAASLPRLGMKEMIVLKADGTHTRFEKAERKLSDGTSEPLAQIAGY